MRLERPAYLQRMAVTLILLIAISAVLAVFTRGFNELLLGIGGLILGVWGVRSVLMPQPVPAVTTIDLALSWVIFLLLVGIGPARGDALLPPQRLAGPTLGRRP